MRHGSDNGQHSPMWLSIACIQFPWICVHDSLNTCLHRWIQQMRNMSRSIFDGHSRMGFFGDLLQRCFLPIQFNSIFSVCVPGWHPLFLSFWYADFHPHGDKTLNKHARVHGSEKRDLLSLSSKKVIGSPMSGLVKMPNCGHVQVCQVFCDDPFSQIWKHLVS